MSEPTSPVLVAFPGSDVRDVPAQMERAAAELRRDDPSAQAAVCVVQGSDGNVQVFGWGNADAVRTLGLMQMGNAEMLRMMGGGT